MKSKLLLWVGAGVGTVVLAGAGRAAGGAAAGGSGGDEPATGGGGDETPGGGGETPAPGGGTPKPGGGTVSKPPGGVGPVPAEPWIVEPYEEYTRGPYTIDLTGLSTGVRWRVYATAEQPTTEPEKDAVKLGAGIEADDEDARVAAEAYVDALGVLPVQPYPMPPKPQPDPPDGAVAPGNGTDAGSGDGTTPPEAGPKVGTTPPEPAPGPGPVLLEAAKPASAGSSPLGSSSGMIQRHGLNVWDGCTRITVDDIVSWVAWAESWIRDRVATTPRVKLVQGLLEASFPGCKWNLAKVRVANGRSLLQQLGVVDGKYFAPVRAGKPWPPQSPWEPLPLERAVAELVGAEAASVVPPEFAYLGYHVEVEETSAGWVWRAWRGGKHGGAADLRGGPEKGWQAAVIAAKDRAHGTAKHE